MTHIVFPSVFLIAETRLVGAPSDPAPQPRGWTQLLKKWGVPGWEVRGAKSDAEALIELAGKSCYMSFDVSLNKNLTRTGTRENQEYIQEQIVKTGHGSVLEHAYVTFAFVNVSRILTHEQVRHRHANYSQTSGRYVRSDDIRYFLPTEFVNDPVAADMVKAAFIHQEEMARKLAQHFGLDNEKDFNRKKRVTSAIRRIIGNGQANHIIVTANHRALRNMLQARTSPGAEEEIRKVWNLVWYLLRDRYSAIYADGYEFHDANGSLFEVRFRNPKV